MDKAKTDLEILLTVIPKVINLASFLGGIVIAILTFAFWFNKNIATSFYVDQKHEESIKFAKDTAAATLQACFDHSDMNRKDMMIEIKSFGTKLDSMTDLIKSLQQQLYETRRR